MKKIIIILSAAVVTAAALFFALGKKKPQQLFEVKPRIDSISVEIRLNGSVNPRNRLELKPQVAGRIEDVLVVEGQEVRKGAVLAWMSSTDRAALLDAARSKGEDEVKRWEDIYKPTPIISPLNGFIIGRNKEPGQTVSLSEVILVMADKLIVTANVDESDLRHIKIDDRVRITLDAYPDHSFPGVIEHIAYESQVISNVTVYEVKIRPLRVPDSFRAGMTSTVEVTSQRKDGVLVIPVDAVTYKNDAAFVTVKKEGKTPPETRKIETGLSNGKSIEVVSGITPDDTLLSSKADFSGAGSSGRNQIRGPGSMFGIGTSKRRN